jgi:hypothetical protein
VRLVERIVKRSTANPGGHYPFVRLVHATGEIYEEAEKFVKSIEDQLARKHIEVEQRRQWLREHKDRSNRLGSVKTIDDFRKDPRNRADGNRIDLAYALYAISNGISEDEIRCAIASRDLNKKGTPKRQAEYIERTIQKALQKVRGQELGR